MIRPLLVYVESLVLIPVNQAIADGDEAVRFDVVSNRHPTHDLDTINDHVVFIEHGGAGASASCGGHVVLCVTRYGRESEGIPCD